MNHFRHITNRFGHTHMVYSYHKNEDHITLKLDGNMCKNVLDNCTTTGMEEDRTRSTPLIVGIVLVVTFLLGLIYGLFLTNWCQCCTNRFGLKREELSSDDVEMMMQKSRLRSLSNAETTGPFEEVMIVKSTVTLS